MKIKGTILFLGDSITDDGRYVAFLNTYLRLYCPENQLESRNFGVSSETLSGLSEPEHPFPRPCLFGRLERILNEVHPDWVVACYGVNDGIYYPFSEERFAAFREGWTKLVMIIRKIGAKLIAMTPPVFDGGTFLKNGGRLYPEGESDYSFIKPYENYNSVMERYARFVREEVKSDLTVDIYSVLKKEYENRRELLGEERPGDGIHPDSFGHLAMARVLLEKWFGVSTENFAETMEKDQFHLMHLVWERDLLEHRSDIERIGHDNLYKSEYLTGKELADAVTEKERRIETYRKQHTELIPKI